MKLFDYNREVALHMCKTIGKLENVPSASYLLNVIKEIEKVLTSDSVDATDMATHKNYEERND